MTESLKFYRLDLQYNGQNFNGWQSQPDGRAVQNSVEGALATILSEQVRVVGASRTDSGVHAKHQVATFRIDRNLDVEKIKMGLTALLPETVGVLSVRVVPSEFHPIKSAKAKIYSYRLWPSKFRDPFLEPFTHRVPSSIDLVKMQNASKMLIGEHDFQSFCASDSSAKTFTRTIYDLRIIERQGMIEFWFLGNGFLKQMVRSLVGTLVGVGVGRFPEPALAEILAAKDRTKAGATAPAKALCLEEIFYAEPYSLDSYIS